jgi:phosphoglucomutase
MEESYGCLAGTYARDKDACVAVMMLCEVAAYYKLKGMTLCDAMQDMREKRENPIQTIGGFKVLKMRDYLIDEVKDMVTGEKSSTGLPKSNVLYYELENNAWCCVRPSGTEPKIKFYYGVKGEDISDAVKKLEAVKADLL